jgi:hypothetical protein
MKSLVVLALVLSTFLTPAAYAKEKNKNVPQEPVVWGMLSQNKGCVIFKEYRKTSDTFWGVAISWKVQGALEVIETQNYNLEQKKWLETQENMNELMRLAVKDRLKFVKIPEKYPDDLLDKARQMCKEPTIKEPTAPPQTAPAQQ